MFAPHLADDPLDHLGMGLQQPHLKIVETVQVVGKVVHQADDAAALGLETGHHVQRAQGHGLGQLPYLQPVLGQVGNEHRPEQAFVFDHRLLVDVLGDQRLPLVQVDGPLLVVEGLELGVFRRTGQDLQLVHCRSGLMPRHEHRGQGELLDQPHRGPHHHAGRLAGLELLQAAGQLHLLVVDAGLVEPVGHETGKVG